MTTFSVDIENVKGLCQLSVVGTCLSPIWSIHCCWTVSNFRQDVGWATRL